MAHRWEWTPGRVVGLVLGLLAMLGLWMLPSPLQAGDGRAALAAGITAWMSIWWLTEAVPITVTAAVPIVVFPLTGVLGGDRAEQLGVVISAYIHPYIFLFLGGMGIAAAMQQCQLHRRLAVQIMRLVGTGPERLLLGFLLATAFVSMWISNTATAAMMLPIGLAVVQQLELRRGGARLHHYGAAVMLAIAYGANLGGIGTKIGTAPNAQLAQFLAVIGEEVSFLQFSGIGVPFIVMMVPAAWWLLWRLARADGAGLGAVGAAALEQELQALGPTRRSEKWVFGVFLATAALWIFGQPLTGLLRDWWPELNTAQLEGSVAMIAMTFLLLLRIEGRQLLELRVLLGQPWGTLILLGGSFAMAEAIQRSGLSSHLGEQLAIIKDLPPLAQVLAATILTVTISAIASNTATTTVMLNVLRTSAVPALLPTLAFASAFAASCDFALPAGTPPNAIVFASGYLSIPRMAKTGVVLDLYAAIVVAFWCFVSVPWLS